ncbi:MAG: hypothetical protein IJH07_08550 [Ruminococcus sp.]|nr:hypothetical protein [Ruminococcus sp.]
MRKLLLSVIVLMLLALTACGTEPVPTEPDATQAPTDAPYIDTQLDEPEWTLAEGELQLNDSTGVIAENADILYFAIVTDADGSQELRFRLSDEIAAILTVQSPDNACYMTLDGERIGEATLDDSCTVVTITAENAVGEITALASRIRGLYE